MLKSVQVRPAPKEAAILTWAKIALGFVATLMASAVGWYFTWSQNSHNKIMQEIEIARNIQIVESLGVSKQDLAMSIMSSFSDDSLYNNLVASMPSQERDKVLSKTLYTSVLTRDYRTLRRILDIMPTNRIEPDGSGHYILASAVNRNDQKLLEFLLRFQFPSHIMGDALIAAAAAGNSDQIRILVERGAEINDRYSGWGTALTAAIKARKFEAVKTLLNYPKIDLNLKDREGKTPLIDALVNEHYDTPPAGEIVSMLLEKGANPNDAWADNTFNPRTALGWAVSSGDNAAFDAIITAGASKKEFRDDNSDSILFAVARDHNISMLQTLLKAKINVNYRDPSYGYTMLFENVAFTPEFVELLTRAGADPNLVDHSGDVAVVKWFSPQIFYATTGRDQHSYLLGKQRAMVKSASIIKKNGADINAKGQWGYTALCNASRSYGGYAVSGLIDLGADIYAICGEMNQTPLEFAIEDCNAESTAIILSQDKNLDYLKEKKENLGKLISDKTAFFERHPDLNYMNPNCESISQMLSGQIDVSQTAHLLKLKYQK